MIQCLIVQILTGVFYVRGHRHNAYHSETCMQDMKSAYLLFVNELVDKHNFQEYRDRLYQNKINLLDLEFAHARSDSELGLLEPVIPKYEDCSTPMECYWERTNQSP